MRVRRGQGEKNKEEKIQIPGWYSEQEKNKVKLRVQEGLNSKRSLQGMGQKIKGPKTEKIKT